MTLPIEYSDLMTLVLFLFALVGFTRGWYKEGITSFCTAALAILVWKPAIAREIIDKLNQIIKMVVMVFKSGFSLDPSQIMAQSVDPGLLLNSDSYRLYVVLTVALLILSYFVGEATFKDRLTPLGRLLGGLLGLFNGYVIVSVIKQYMLLDLSAKGQMTTQANELSIQMTDVPMNNIFAGYGIIFVFIVVIGVVALLIAGDRLKLPLK
jgi:hypothetical protein